MILEKKKKHTHFVLKQQFQFITLETITTHKCEPCSQKPNPILMLTKKEQQQQQQQKTIHLAAK